MEVLGEQVTMVISQPQLAPDKTMVAAYLLRFQVGLTVVAVDDSAIGGC